MCERERGEQPAQIDRSIDRVDWGKIDRHRHRQQSIDIDRSIDQHALSPPPKTKTHHPQPLSGSGHPCTPAQTRRPRGLEKQAAPLLRPAPAPRKRRRRERSTQSPSRARRPCLPRGSARAGGGGTMPWRRTRSPAGAGGEWSSAAAVARLGLQRPRRPPAQAAAVSAARPRLCAAAVAFAAPLQKTPPMHPPRPLPRRAGQRLASDPTRRETDEQPAAAEEGADMRRAAPPLEQQQQHGASASASPAGSPPSLQPPLLLMVRVLLLPPPRPPKSLASGRDGAARAGKRRTLAAAAGRRAAAACRARAPPPPPLARPQPSPTRPASGLFSSAALRRLFDGKTPMMISLCSARCPKEEDSEELSERAPVRSSAARQMWCRDTRLRARVVWWAADQGARRSVATK